MAREDQLYALVADPGKRLPVEDHDLNGPGQLSEPGHPSVPQETTPWPGVAGDGSPLPNVELGARSGGRGG